MTDDGERSRRMLGERRKVKKQAKRYVATPGRWEACITFKKGDKAFA